MKTAFPCMAALALALSACASLAPPYERPALPVAAGFPEADAATGAAAASLDWREYFADARLRQLIAQALENNRDLRIAALRVEEARAAYGIQRAEQFPTIGLGAEGSRSRTPADLNLTQKPLLSSQYQVGLNVSAWELDFWGRVRSLKDAALHTMLASDAARRAVTAGLIAQVADGYLSLRELDERVELASRTVASRTESLRIFTRRFEVGSTSKLELTQVVTLLTQAQTLGAQLEQARALRLHALEQLVGAPLATAAPEAGFDDATVLRELRAGLPSELLTARPDIAAAEQQLRAAQANIGAARAAFFPRITLTSAFGTASAEFDGLFDAGSRAWNVLPRLTLPIFDAGRNRAGLDLAAVRRDVAVANYEKSVQNAFREVADAMSARRWLAEQLRIQQGALAAQTERARLAKLRYDNGATPYLEVLDAQRDLLSAEQQLVQTRRALLSSQVSLYAALGGGAPAPAQ
ncbi:efflux transporter outer membrane subunit [Janthinobacterium sp.]|uniref:efflux transporter outer membrane subunit n=1 Tax=Janthinobacterium sp. TaxID=1871054 RepID=UPI00293D26ED|nr:efflux transporter outer membrane subunit [Janthinobacterium sp.]